MTLKDRPSFILAAIAFLSRFAYGLRLVLQGTYLDRGNEHFVQMAQSLLNGQGYARAPGVPTAIYTPLFPFSLALLFLNPWLILLMQAALSGGTVFLLYRLGERFLDRRSGAVAALIYIFNVYMVSSEVAMNDTNLFIFLFVATSYALLMRPPTLKHCFQAGVLLGLSFLARSMTIILVPGVLLWIWLYTGAGRLVRLKRMAVVLAAFCLCWLPWVARNQFSLGSPVLTTTWANVNLWKGNNEYTDVFYPAYFYDSLEVPGLGPSEELTEIEQEAWYRDRAIRYIRDHPYITARRTFLKTLLFFHVRLIPYNKEGYIEAQSRTVQHVMGRPRIENLIYTATYLPVLLGFFWGFYRAWRQKSAPPLVGYTLILTIFFSLLYASTTYMTRYRLPVEPFFYLFTAWGWFDGASRLRRSRQNMR